MGIFLTVVAIAIILYIYIRYSNNLKIKKALKEDGHTTFNRLHVDLQNNENFRIAHEIVGADLKSLLAIDIINKQIAFTSVEHNSIELFTFNELLEVSKWEDNILIRRLATPEYAEAHLSGQQEFIIDENEIHDKIHSLDLELTFSNGTIQKKKVNFLPSIDPVTQNKMTYYLDDIQRDSVKEKIEEWEILLSSIIKDKL